MKLIPGKKCILEMLGMSLDKINSFNVHPSFIAVKKNNQVPWKVCNKFQSFSRCSFFAVILCRTSKTNFSIHPHSLRQTCSCSHSPQKLFLRTCVFLETLPRSRFFVLLKSQTRFLFPTSDSFFFFQVSPPASAFCDIKMVRNTLVYCNGHRTQSQSTSNYV